MPKNEIFIYQKYSSPEQIFQLFTNAALSGRLLPRGRALQMSLKEKGIEWDKGGMLRNMIDFETV